MVARDACARASVAAGLVALCAVAGCGRDAAPDDALAEVRAPPVDRLAAVDDVLAGADVPTLDPASLDPAQVRRMLPDGARCEFRYAGTGRPVLAVRLRTDGTADAALVRLNGRLVRLGPATDRAPDAAGLAVGTGPVRIVVTPDPSDAPAATVDGRRRDADMRFEIGSELSAGYRGYLECRADAAVPAGGADARRAAPRLTPP